MRMATRFGSWIGAMRRVISLWFPALAIDRLRREKPGAWRDEPLALTQESAGRVIVSAYVICAVLTAVAAIFFAMYTRSISPSSHGNFYELYAIAAAVLGGFSLRGGEGSIIGVVLGAVLLQVLQNLVNLLGIPSSLNFAVMGSVILIGVLADQQFDRYRRRRAARVVMLRVGIRGERGFRAAPAASPRTPAGLQARRPGRNPPPSQEQVAEGQTCDDAQPAAAGASTNPESRIPTRTSCALPV